MRADGPVPDTMGDSGLELILDEVDTVVDPLAESMTLGPAMGIAVAGGPMVTLPPNEPAPGLVGSDNTLKAGLLQAGPVAVAGMAVNVAAALVVIAVARLLSSQAYGELAQLLGLFFILSMPGSAVLVGVVRRVTGLQTTGRAHLVPRLGGPGAPDLPGRAGRRVRRGGGPEGLDRWPAPPAQQRERRPDPDGRRGVDPPLRGPGPPPGAPPLRWPGHQPARRGRCAHRARARPGGRAGPVFPATPSACW